MPPVSLRKRLDMWQGMGKNMFAVIIERSIKLNLELINALLRSEKI